MIDRCHRNKLLSLSIIYRTFLFNLRYKEIFSKLMSYLQRIKVAFAGEKFYPQYTSGWNYFIIILFFDVTIEINKTRKYSVFYCSSSACNSRFQKSIGRKSIFIQ